MRALIGTLYRPAGGGAATKGHAELVRLLLAKGANADLNKGSSADEEGAWRRRTPLCIAARQGPRGVWISRAVGASGSKRERR